MKVILADYSGFCFGVQKAIDTTIAALDNKGEDEKICSLGPLIHNLQVVKEFEKKGLQVINDINEAAACTVIIRSHGVPENVYTEAMEKSIKIIDTTCPFVRRIQNIVKEYYNKGYTIAIMGDSNHPEVIGIKGWCGNQALIVNEEADIEKLPEINKLCIVSQTTMSLKQYEILNQMLEKKAHQLVKFNTICSATKKRQEAAQKLSEKVEAMLVIGGSHSSNTQKLVAICKKEKPESTYHVETAEDLPVELIKKYNVIGITAGASTPKWIINEIIQKINTA